MEPRPESERYDANGNYIYMNSVKRPPEEIAEGRAYAAQLAVGGKPPLGKKPPWLGIVALVIAAGYAISAFAPDDEPASTSPSGYGSSTTSSGSSTTPSTSGSSGKSVDPAKRAGYLACLENLDNEIDACHMIYVAGWSPRDGDNLGAVRFNSGWNRSRYESCMNNPDSFSRSEVPNSCKAAAIANPGAAAFADVRSLPMPKPSVPNTTFPAKKAAAAKKAVPAGLQQAREAAARGDRSRPWAIKWHLFDEDYPSKATAAYAQACSWWESFGPAVAAGDQSLANIVIQELAPPSGHTGLIRAARAVAASPRKGAPAMDRMCRYVETS